MTTVHHQATPTVLGIPSKRLSCGREFRGHREGGRAKITGEMSGFLRTVGLVGRKNLGRAAEKPNIREDIAEGETAHRAGGRNQEVTVRRCSKPPCKLQFVDINGYHAHSHRFLFSYDILILMSSANPLITQMRKLGAREGKMTLFR